MAPQEAETPGRMTAMHEAESTNSAVSLDIHAMSNEEHQTRLRYLQIEHETMLNYIKEEHELKMEILEIKKAEALQNLNNSPTWFEWVAKWLKHIWTMHHFQVWWQANVFDYNIWLN